MGVSENDGWNMESTNLCGWEFGVSPSNKCFSTFSDNGVYVSFSQCFSAIALEGRDTTREPNGALVTSCRSQVSLTHWIGLREYLNRKLVGFLPLNWLGFPVVFPLNQSNHLTGLKLQVLEAGEELLAQLEHRSLQSRLAGVDGCYIDCAQSTCSGSHSMLAYQTRIYVISVRQPSL